MTLRDVPIKRKLTLVIMMTSAVALILTAGAFVTYEVISFRKNLLQSVETIAQITADQTSTSVYFDDEKTASDILSKLRAEPAIIQAAVYNESGKIIAWHPASAAIESFPQREPPGERFGRGSLNVFVPVEEDDEVLGMLYVKWDLGPAYARFRLYGLLMLSVLLCSILAALIVSRWLQARISQPILDLAKTARAISVNKDYLVRAKAPGNDEIGALTDAFNHMLMVIHDRDEALQDNQGKLQKALEAAERSGSVVRALNADLERRVEQRTGELKSANHELEAFTYSVSHDLRSPLRHIDAFAQILVEDHGATLDAEARRCVERIRNGVENMGRLVDDLLNLSRVGRAELQKEQVELGALVEETVAELRPETKNREIEWRVGPLPAANCDPGLVKQVFVNLLSNAVKYTRPRAKAVIEVGQTVAAGAPAIFVRDNGVGFNMKYVNKLFGVFQRLHRVEEFEGTGVGLATVQRIVTLHGGKIWAEAELDKGATFYFTLGQPSAEGST